MKKTFTLKLDLEKIDFYIFQLELILHKKNLNKPKLKVLAYYYLFDNPMEKLVTDGIFVKKTVENYVSELRSEGILVGKGRKQKTVLNPKIRLLDEACNLTIDLNILE